VVPVLELGPEVDEVELLEDSPEVLAELQAAVVTYMAWQRSSNNTSLPNRARQQVDFGKSSLLPEQTRRVGVRDGQGSRPRGAPRWTSCP
jgi:hypothetical protein